MMTVKNISIYVALFLFSAFSLVHGKENIHPSESVTTDSRHSHYISYDISRDEVGIGYRYQHKKIMCDFNGTYKYLMYSSNNGYRTSLSLHLLSILKESTSFILYSGIGVKEEFYSLNKSRYRKKDRTFFYPSFCCGYSFDRSGRPSPFAEIYYLPIRCYSKGHDAVKKIGLKVGLLY